MHAHAYTNATPLKLRLIVLGWERATFSYQSSIAKKAKAATNLCFGIIFCLERMFVLPASGSSFSGKGSLLQPPPTLRSLHSLNFCNTRTPHWEMRVEGRTDAILKLLLGNRGLCGVNTLLFSSSSSHKTSVVEERLHPTFCQLSFDTTVCMTQDLY